MKRLLKLFLVLVSLHSYGQTYFINENFSSGSVVIPPSGWQNITVGGGSTAQWHFDNPGNKNLNYPMTTPFAIFDAQAITPGALQQSVALETPTFNAASATNTLLSFDHVYSPAVGAQAKIQVSSDGTTWQDVASYKGSTTNLQHEVVDLSPYAAGNASVKLRFQWEGDSLGYWAIDNVKIYTPANIDAGISAINSPFMPFAEGTNDVKVALTNYGYSNLTSATIRWSVNGSLQTPYPWTGNILFGDSQQNISLGSQTFQAGKNYQVKIWSENPNGSTDLNLSNDTIIRNLVPSLCGTYTIGGSSPDFLTFNAATSVLTNAGITCPVVFNIRNGSYVEEVEINTIPGTSLTNTVTFQAESGDSSQVIVSNKGDVGYIPTIRINGAKNIALKKLGITMNYYGGGLIVENSADNIEISNCRINSGNFCQGIQLRNGAKNISIHRNYFTGLIVGINAVVMSNVQKIKIYDNTILGYSLKGGDYYPIKGFSGINNLLIDNNDIYPYSGDPAINIDLGNDTISITNNHIYDASINISGGLEKGLCTIGSNHLKSSLSSGIVISTKNGLIANNWITILGNSLQNGIELDICNNTRVVFNSIHLLNSNSESKCLLIDGGNEFEIKNNILSNPGGGYSAYMVNSPSLGVWDFNDYFNLYNRTGNVSTTIYPDFLTWASAVNGESHGLSCNPEFTNDSTLIPHQILLKNAGTPVSDVPTDLVGNVRNPSTPDIGAIEFSPCSLDAGINAISAPTNPASEGLQDIKVILQNQGTATLNTVAINWTVNGLAQTPYSWTGTLTNGKNAEVTLGQITVQSGTAYSVKAWTSGPNNLNDCDAKNDTVVSAKIYARLCGTYTIGGLNPNFQTFSDAISALTNAGITCPVVFNVRTGIYPEQISLNSIPGSSTVNTVMFESEVEDSTQVLITNQTGLGPTLTVNGAKNIQFKNLGIEKIGPNIGDLSSWSLTILVENSSDNIIISNCRILTSGYTYGIQVGSFSKNISFLNNSIYAENAFNTLGIYLNDLRNMKIDGNNIQNYPTAIYIGPNDIDKVRINNNEVRNCGIGFLIHSANDSLFITNNKIYQSSNSYYSAIHLDGGGGSGSWGLIQGNWIKTSASSGIMMNSRSGLVSNNSISILGDSKLSGIELNASSKLKVVYNSIHLLNTNPGSKCLQLNGGSDIEIKNNIFSNPSGGYSVYIPNNPTSSVWDYNNYYNLFNRTGFLGSSTYPSFQAWSGAINDENHGLSCNPFFLNDSTLVPQQTLLNNAGIPVHEVKFDIDSTLRNSSTPDIGAKEISLCTLDAGINALTSPAMPAVEGLQPVKVILQNQGTATLSSVTINWILNGVVQTPINWTGLLAGTQNAEITLGNLTVLSGTIYHIKAWSSSPNQGADCNAINDTVVCNNIYAKLCRTYTIGGSNPNFQTFSDAVSVLNRAGITCPVIFNVRDGIYQEHFEIDSIHGSSTTNTVTFQSESGDSSQVIVTYKGDKPMIMLSGAKNIIFNKLGMHGEAPQTFLTDNFAENISVSNCIINNSGGGQDIYISSGSNNISINNNLINGGIQLFNANNTIISGNIIQNSGGIFSSGTYSKLHISGNELIQGCSGISIYDVFDSVYVTGNRLTGSGISCQSMGWAHGVSNGYSLIEGNKISTSSIYSGIIVKTTNCLVANNYITISGDNPGNGIDVDNCPVAQIAYNSINVTSDNLNSSKCIRINGGDTVDLKNNIFNNSAYGACFYFDKLPTLLNSDYNDYYSPYSAIGYANSTPYNSMSSWGTAISGEANSVFSNPFFISDSIPTPNQILLKNAATVIPQVTVDIDSTLRSVPVQLTSSVNSSGSKHISNPSAVAPAVVSAGNPDIGAKQFIPCANDAGVNQITSPMTPISSGIQSFKVILQNQGTNNLTSVKIYWQINGGDQAPLTWTGTLTSKQNVQLTLGSYKFVSGGDYTLKAWTAIPNGIGDCDHFNDTTVLHISGNPLPPDPAGSITGLTKVCQGSSNVIYAVPAIAGATTYIWNLPAGLTGTSTFDTIAVTVNASAVSGSISVYGQNPVGNGTASSLAVTVNPMPVAPTVGAITQPTCALPTGSVALSGLPATGTWTLTRNPGVVTTTGTGVSKTISSLLAGTYNYSVTNATGCMSGPSNIIAIKAVISGSLVVCVGSTTQLTGTGTAATTTPWTSATTSVATISSTGLVTGKATGTSVITFKNSAGCSATTTVTVYPIPSITGTLTVCAGSTTQLAGSGTSATTNPWISGTPAVATVSANGLVTGVSAGTSVITFTNSGGCTKTATVTVSATPTISGKLNICIGATSQLTGSGTAASSGPWVSASPAVASVSNTGLVSAKATGTSLITFKNSNGCTSTAIVSVYEIPTITGTLTVCSGSTTQLTGSGTPDVTNPWISSAPAVASVSTSGMVTGLTAGKSVITYTNMGGCTKTTTVTVNAVPAITGTLSVCFGSTTQLTGSGAPASSNPWVSATPKVAMVNSKGLVTGTGAGTSTITFTNINGCSQTVTVTVYPIPTIAGALTLCVGSTTQLTGSALAATINPWVSATPAIATVSAIGVVTGVSLGTSLITYTNSAGCKTTSSVTVSAAPTIAGTLTLCAGATTQLTGSGTAATISPWVSSSTSVATVSNAGLVTGVAAGTSIITYRNIGGCTKTATITVSAAPTITGNLAVCIGATTQLAGSATAASSTPWVSGTPSVATISNTGLVTGIAVGSSMITYKNSGGCTKTATVTVSSVPTITGTLSLCAGATTQLTGSGTASSTTPWVSASTSVATVSTTGLVTGVAAGTAVITFTNSGGCKTMATVTVLAAPVITGTVTVCAGLTTQLSGSGTAASTTPWVSSTTTVATVNSTGLVTGVAAGTSVITFTNNGGCKKTLIVTVSAKPAITGTLTTCIGSTTQLTGSGTAATTTPWVSGTTPVASVSSTGLVTGIAAGTSVITYTNSGGCKIVATVTVNAAPTITGTLTVCAGSTTQLTGSATASGTSPWVSGTTAVATVSSTGLVTGVAAGTSIITYTNSSGCKKTATVTVSAGPVAPVAAAATTITSTGFSAKWAASTGATGYYLDVSTNNTFTSFVTGYSIKNVGNVVTSAVTGLTSGITYYYRVRSFNASCTSINSSTISLTTLASIPATPVASAATSVISTGFSANWAVSSGATGYYLDVSTSSTFASFVTGYNNKSAGNVVTSAVTGLTANTTYYYRIRAFNTAGTSARSTIISVKTAPAAPVATAATSIAQTSFSAKWNASTGATGYYLDVSKVNNFASFVTGFNNKSVGNLVTTSATGLTASTTYYYRVRAFNTGGTSGNSNTITVTSLKSAIIPTDSLQGNANSPAQIIEILAPKNKLNVYPNPTSGSTTFEFQVNENAKVMLDIFSVSGQHIARIFDADVTSGASQSVKFDQSLPTGIYPCVLRWKMKMITVKLVIKK